MPPKSEPIEDPTSPAELFRRSSYQQSPRSSSQSSGGKRRRDSAKEIFQMILRRFSIDAGYETPPLEEDFEEVDETALQGRAAKLSCFQRLRQSSPVGTCAVVAGIVAILIVVFASRHTSPARNNRHHPVYTGDPPVCHGDNYGPSVQDLKSFASLQDIEHGAVAADHPTCSNVGLQMLRDLNGNAVDAAVATALCLGVANPSSSGIGGGAFILIHASESQNNNNNNNKKLPQFHDARNQSLPELVSHDNKITEVIDCRDVAGQAASTYMYETEGVPTDASLYGGLAVAVPGELRGLELAHARHGRLDWATVVRPAMELARDGIPVYNHLAHDIESFSRKQRDHGGFPTLRKLLTHDNNWKHFLKEGEILRNPKLAETLQAVMEEGADAVYTGKRAEQLAQEIQKAGGIVTKQDLKNYLPTLRTPVVSDNVFGFRVVGVPPPSSGGAVIIGALRFLKGYVEPLAAYADTLSIHRMVEALKHVFAIRMSLADPAYPLGNNVTGATTQDAVDALVQGPYMEQLRQMTRDDGLLNLSYYGGAKFAQLKDSDGQKEATDAKEGDRRRRRLQETQQPQQARRRLYDPFGYLEDHGTSHLSVVDKDGNAVAMTTSVNAQFGACLVSESTGIVFNNQMDDFGNPGRPNYFGLKPSEANFIQPGKKPLSSMSPTMVFQAGSDAAELGQLRLVLGGSGGPKIITAVFQVIINYLLLGKPLFDSVAHPRIHNQLIYHGSATTTVENSFVHPSEINLQVSNRTRAALDRRGHPIVDIDYAGTVQAVAVDTETGLMEAMCDVRKGGSPVGY